MASWEKLFPELAAYLPADEAELLTAEFAAQLARLRGAGFSSHSLADFGPGGELDADLDTVTLLC